MSQFTRFQTSRGTRRIAAAKWAAVMSLITAAQSLHTYGASIAFTDNTLNTSKAPYSYGFSARADPEGSVDGLNDFTKVNGSRFPIKVNPTDNTPVQSTLTLLNADNNENPTDMPFPQGSISWTQYSVSPKLTYSFTISAGGKYNHYPHAGPYTLAVAIDGAPVCSVSTISSTDTAYTVCTNIPFDNRSSLNVTLTPIQ